MMKRLYNILILLLPIFVYAQSGIDLKSSGGYTGNAFNNYNQNSDYYTWLNANVNQDWHNENSGLRLYYDGSAILYKQYTDKNYMNHEAGLSYFNYLTDNGNRFNAGFSFEQRQHSDTYRWFEMNTTSLYASLKFIISSQWYTYLGMNVQFENYETLTPFSNNQTQFYVRVSRFFDSGTTLIAETDLFSKYYQSWDSYSTIENFPNIVTVGDNHSQQIQALVRVAQSVTPKTGLSGQVLFRHNLTNSTRYLGTESGYYYSDEEIFNDAFGYHTAEYDIKLKQILPWSSTITLGTSYKERDYQNRVAMDLEGNPYPDYRNRRDERLSFWVNLQKKIGIGNLKPTTLSLSLTHMNNRSNDLYYDYQSQYLTFSISQALK